jgi:putative membrane protein
MCLPSTTVTAQDAEILTDSQIIHIVYTAGQIDTAAANLALKNSSNNVVRDFANVTLRDYAAAYTVAASLIAKLNINPQDNAISRSLAGAAAEHAQRLSKLSGGDFDKAYIQNELAFYVFISGALEVTLIPSAQNSEIKSLLQNELALIRHYQIMVRNL